MPCNPLSFSGVDASKWETLRETIQGKYGIRIDSEKGDAEERGFSLRWAYDPGAGTLEIQCLGKPLIVPCSLVNSYINSAAEKAGLAA